MKAGPTLPFNCRHRILSFLPLPQSLPSFSLSGLSAGGKDGPCSAGSSKTRRGGLGVSNEITPARFRTFTKYRTFSNSGTMWWMTREKDGGLVGRDKTDEAWNGKSEVRKRRKTFSNLGKKVHVRSSLLHVTIKCAETLSSPRNLIKKLLNCINNSLRTSYLQLHVSNLL